jgi:hypothetical protein
MAPPQTSSQLQPASAASSSIIDNDIMHRSQPAQLLAMAPEFHPDRGGDVYC